ncbi:MAG: DUF711 family protein [Chloroflexi bacterium]|nr:DUF711 family protein [Chloroflexota bacterium]MQC26388.1 DUF711 family protein [Chloroflexota bacterium]
MKIRSITGFLNPGWPLDEAALDTLATVIQDAKKALEAEGYEVQTLRLASVPFPTLLEPFTEEGAVALAVGLGHAASERGFGYVSLGPALIEEPRSYAAIPSMLDAAPNVLFGGALTGANGEISMQAIRACARLIKTAASMEPNGFTNLRFAALANVPAGAPFFPAAYHSGEAPAFALATQAADLAVAAFSDAKTIDAGAQGLTRAIESHGQTLAAVSEPIAKRHGVVFGGIDFSLAPFTVESESLGAAIERMGVPAIGMQGSLAAAAILTSAIDAAAFPRAGFNGLLMPPLEDSVLAKRAAEGHLSVNDLLMYSAVCGTGLDTIALPGETTEEELASLLLDVAALAIRLDKPLTARLMPIPGKQVGDMTNFDFEFFTNSRVLALKSQGLGNAFLADQTIQIRSR